jgi:hypothetical protein
MWERQSAERDFTEDIQEAKRLYRHFKNLTNCRKDESIEKINEIMDEIRAEVY